MSSQRRTRIRCECVAAKTSAVGQQSERQHCHVSLVRELLGKEVLEFSDA